MTTTTREQLRAAGIDGEPGRHLELLVAITQEFAASLDVGETLKTAADRVRQLLDAEAASLFLLQDDRLLCRACSGPIDITGMTLDKDQGIVGKTVRERRPLMVRDVGSDPDFSGAVDQQTGFVTRSILSVPLCVKEYCLGALELINKKSGDGLFDEPDRDLLMALAALAALAIHNARMALALVEQERMRQELELARAIQRRLLPAALPEPGCVAGINIPAREVSGDFFGYLPLADGRIAFNLGDVAGKGMDAALLMAKTSSLLRYLSKQAADPARMLAQVNDELCETAALGKFVTLVAGLYCPASGRVMLANAGHQPPLLHTRDDRFIEYPAASPPLGILPNIDFPTTEFGIDDGCLYLFTDGLTEARDPSGNQLGLDGAKARIRATAGLAANQRLAAITESIQGPTTRQHDDITLLVIEPVGRAAGAQPDEAGEGQVTP